MTLTLASEVLEVDVDVDLGGGIRQVTVLPSGRRLLAETPWHTQCDATGPLPAGSDLSAWLERYRGGWQVLLPNVGPRGVVDGVAHGWHGEGSLNPFVVLEQSERRATLVRDLVAAPLRVTREIAVEDNRVSVTDEVHNDGAEEHRFLWQHHPAFGGDLLDGPVRLRHAASADAVDDVGAPASSLSLVPDLPRDAWAALEQTSGPGSERLAIVLAWEQAVFPLLWVWRETGADPGPPWFGRLRAVGLEPAQHWPATGLEGIDGRTHGDPTVLEAGRSRRTTVRLTCGVGDTALETLLTEPRPGGR
jgi:hypothetical protein